MRERLTLNVAMLEQAEAKVTGHGNDLPFNDALAETICETFSRSRMPASIEKSLKLVVCLSVKRSGITCVRNLLRMLMK
jgi:hypothetical protein